MNILTKAYSSKMKLALLACVGVAAAFSTRAGSWASSTAASTNVTHLAVDREVGGKVTWAMPIGAGDIRVDLPRPTVERVVRAADYGFSVTNDDNGAAIQRALGAAHKLGASRVVLAPGVYHCFGDKGFFIEDFTDFTFDGCGAELVFRRLPHYPMNPPWDHDHNLANVIVRGCRRIRIKDLNMDWDWHTMPLATCARVVARHVDDKEGCSYCDFELVGHGARHPLYGKVFPVQRTQQMTADFRHFNKGRNWWHGAYEGDVGVQGEWLDPTHVRVRPCVRKVGAVYWDGPNKRTFAPDDNAKAVRDMNVGDTVRIAHCYYGKGAIAMESNEHLTLEKINVYSCYGHGLYICGSQHHWQAKDVSFAPRDWAHPISSSADAVHFVRSRGQAIIDNLTVKLEQDDAINVHDRFTVAKTVGPRTLEVILERQARYFVPEIGDLVELRAPNLGPLGWFAHVTALHGERIVFDRDLPPQPKEGWFCVFDRMASSDGIIIRNCTFEDVDSRALLVNVSDATVENCVFRRSELDCLRTMADYTLKFWCEGMGSTNIVVRNCLFEANCVRGMANSYYSLGADISAWIGLPAGVKSADLWRPFLSSVLVEGCVFRDSLSYFADIRCGERFAFRNNRIEDTGRRANRRVTSGSARLENVHDVLFENNVFTFPQDRVAPTFDVAADVRNLVLRGNRK